MSDEYRNKKAEVRPGLEGVLAFESKVAYIDGHAPEFLIRGYDISDLTHKTDYEQVAYLLLYGRMPTIEESEAFRAELSGLRVLPDPVLDLIESTPSFAHPMAVLRTAVSMLGTIDPNADEIDVHSLLDVSKSLIAKFATIVAAQKRVLAGLEPVAPKDKSLGHAENYLYMLTGELPDDAMRRTFDATLVLYAEHETNASTFACRVVVGTLSDLYSAVVAGIGTIKGPLHGGAIDDAMRMLAEIGSPDRVDGYIDQALTSKRKLPGFGHRVYRAGDPRAAELRRMALRMADALDDRKWFDIALLAEKRMAKMKGIIPNVDYYAAPVMYQLGFPLSLMTNVVASARIAGWTAHILEQYENNRLIRPRALYVGDRSRQIDVDR